MTLIPSFTMESKGALIGAARYARALSKTVKVNNSPELYSPQCWVVEASLIPLFLDNYENITSTEGLEQRPIRPKFLIYGFPENSLVEQGAVRSLLSHSLMKSRNYQKQEGPCSVKTRNLMP